MFRGTTPQLEFSFNYNLEDLNIQSFYITLKQENNTVAEKELNDITIVKEKAIINLTQEETLSMIANIPVSIQARLKINNKVYATNILSVGVSSVLKEGVI